MGVQCVRETCESVKTVALNDEIEIIGECEEIVSDPAAGSSKDLGSNLSKQDESTSENGEVARMKEKIAILENEMLHLKEEVAKGDETMEAKINAKIGATKLNDEEPPAAGRLSDWAQTQFRCLETYIGRARRETFDRRLKFKREVEYEVRDYLCSLDAQINKLRSRVTLVEVEMWPGGGPLVREQKMALAGRGLFAKVKGWRAEWIERDDDWTKEEANPLE